MASESLSAKGKSKVGENQFVARNDTLISCDQRG